MQKIASLFVLVLIANLSNAQCVYTYENGRINSISNDSTFFDIDKNIFRKSQINEFIDFFQGINTHLYAIPDSIKNLGLETTEKYFIEKDYAKSHDANFYSFILNDIEVAHTNTIAIPAFGKEYEVHLFSYQLTFKHENIYIWTEDARLNYFFYHRNLGLIALAQRPGTEEDFSNISSKVMLISNSCLSLEKNLLVQKIAGQVFDRFYPFRGKDHKR